MTDIYEGYIDYSYRDETQDFREMSQENALEAHRRSMEDRTPPLSVKELEKAQETFDALMRDGGRVEFTPGIWVSVEIAEKRTQEATR